VDIGAFPTERLSAAGDECRRSGQALSLWATNYYTSARFEISGREFQVAPFRSQ
jgi:hypothetical protein